MFGGELADQFFPHLTGGMGIKEDMEQSPIKATAVRKDRPSRGSAGLRAVLDQYEADSRDVQDADVEEDEGPAGLSEPAFNALGDIERAGTREELKQIMDALDGTLDEGEHKQLHSAATARWRELPADVDGEQA